MSTNNEDMGGGIKPKHVKKHIPISVKRYIMLPFLRFSADTEFWAATSENP